MQLGSDSTIEKLKWLTFSVELDVRIILRDMIITNRRLLESSEKSPL